MMKKIITLITMSIFTAGMALAQDNTNTNTTKTTTTNGKTTTTKVTKKHKKKKTGSTTIVKDEKKVETTTTQDNQPKSAIKFKEVVYNFGEVAYGSDVSHAFMFTNVSRNPVAIKDVGTSCGCTTPNYSKEPVAPGKTGSVTAKYDSTRPGPFNKSLTVFVNDEQIKLTITGTVKAPNSDNNNQKGK
jgi:Ni/Co efflux regulator RcnB